jgi:hypothetical protein
VPPFSSQPPLPLSPPPALCPPPRRPSSPLSTTTGRPVLPRPSPFSQPPPPLSPSSPSSDAQVDAGGASCSLLLPWERRSYLRPGGIL